MRRESALRAEVETWDRDLAPLLISAPNATPSPDTWPRIESRIDATETARDSMRTILKTDATWTTFLPGVRKSSFILTGRTRFSPTFFGWRQARRSAPRPQDDGRVHRARGEVSLAGQTLSAGDFQMFPVGSHHVEMFSTGGAVVLRARRDRRTRWDVYRFARNIGARFSRETR